MEHYNALTVASVDCTAEQWAKTKDTDPNYAATEKARWHLLRFIKGCTNPEEWRDSAIGVVNVYSALHAVITCMEYDRANALFIMKADRDDPDCPAGFPWVTKENLPDVKTSKNGKYAMHCHSISAHYLRFARLFYSEADEAEDTDEQSTRKSLMRHIKELHATECPEWWGKE